MDKDVEGIIVSLNSIQSLEDVDELNKLENALKQLSITKNREQATETLFNVYERFPLADGYGLFWSILHLLEKFPNYEPLLVQSIHRQPTEWSMLMINRILNTGRTHIDEIDLLTLLQEVANNTNQTKAIRDGAQRFIDWQKSRT